MASHESYPSTNDGLSLSLTTMRSYWGNQRHLSSTNSLTADFIHSLAQICIFASGHGIPCPRPSPPTFLHRANLPNSVPLFPIVTDPPSRSGALCGSSHKVT